MAKLPVRYAHRLELLQGALHLFSQFAAFLNAPSDVCNELLLEVLLSGREGVVPEARVSRCISQFTRPMQPLPFRITHKKDGMCLKVACPKLNSVNGRILVLREFKSKAFYACVDVCEVCS